MTDTENTKLIPLTQGKFAIVDATDYEHLMQWKWNGSLGYAMRGQAIKGTRKKINILMHRLIMNAPQGLQVDHINGNKLDNRKSNLRICTTQQNTYNSKAIGGASQYKGVYKHRNKWRAMISFQRKRYTLGAFDTEEGAAMAYDKAALQYHGEFARLNFPLAPSTDPSELRWNPSLSSANQ